MGYRINRSSAAVERDAFANIVVFLLVLVPALSGVKRGLLFPGLKLSDLLVIVCLVLVLLGWGLRRRAFDLVGFFLLTYSCLHALFTLINFSQRVELETDLLPKEIVGAAQYFLMYFIAFACGQRSGTMKVFIRWQLLVAACVAIIAVLQLFNIGPVREFLTLITGNPEIAHPLSWKTYRASGTFVSWHALGMYLAISAVIGFAVLFGGQVSGRQRRRVMFLLFLIVVGLLSSLTATPIFLFILGVIFFLRRSRINKYAPLLLVGSVAIVLATPLAGMLEMRLENQVEPVSSEYSWLPQTVAYRLTVWSRDYGPIISDNIWDGYGPLGEFDTSAFKYTESMYVSLLLTGGIFLLFAFLVMLLAASVRMNWIRKSRPIDGNSLPQELASAMFLITVFLVPAMFLHPYLSDAGGAPLYFIFLGLVSGAADSAKGVLAEEGPSLAERGIQRFTTYPLR